MDSIWIIVIIALGIVAAASTISVLIGERAPRVAPDPERLARLRDRITADLSLRGREQVEERIAEELDARTETPQRRSPISTERLWAGGLGAARDGTSSPLVPSRRQAENRGMDGNWLSSVPLDGTWLTLLMTIGAAGAAGSIVALLRQRTPRTRIDLARVASRRSAAH